jgi:beta-lactamase regulating signal transducer with metallopeptidase domain
MTTWMAGIVLESILNGLLQGLALAAAVWLLLRLAPRANAATRYAVWTATLAAVVCLPWLGLAPAGAGAVSGSAAGAAAGSAGAAGLVLVLPPPGRWVLFPAAGWGLISLALLARVAWSYRAILRLKKEARPLDPAYRERLERAIAGYGLRRKVRLAESDAVAAPMAAGLSQPVILIPAGLAGHLSHDELEQVLMHEAAHLRRFDDWTNLAQKVLEAVFFFHPAVIWIGRKLNLEREIACDDWVVAATGNARPYAACLTRLVELSRPGRSPQLAHGAVARKRQITRRVESLLSRRRNPSARFSAAATAAASGALVVAAAMAVQVSPVRVAEPAIPAIGSPRAAVAPAMAYAKPPRPAPAAPARSRAVYAKARGVQRSAPQTVIASSAPHALSGGAVAIPAAQSLGVGALQYVLIQQWIAPVSGDGPGIYCVFYLGGAAQASPAEDASGWIAIRWCRPAAAKKASLNRA